MRGGGLHMEFRWRSYFLKPTLKIIVFWHETPYSLVCTYTDVSDIPFENGKEIEVYRQPEV